MKNSQLFKLRLIAPLLGSIATILPSFAADIQKANNTVALNTGTSWVGGAVPGLNDVALFDSTLTVANTSPVGGNLDLGGIRVTNPVGSVIFGATAGTTIGLGASGVDMSAATQALLLEGAISINASQAWAVTNASTAGAPFAGTARQFNNNEDFAFNGGNTAGNNIAFNLNGNTISTSGTGTIEITSGYAISNGTINVGNSVFHIQGGASKLTSIASTVTFNLATGSRLFFQSNSGALNSAAVVNLNGGTLQFTSNNASQVVTQSGNVNVATSGTLLVANNVANGGSTSALTFNGNLLGAGALAINNTATADNFLRLAGDNSGFTGTATLGGNAGKATRLASFTAGSAAATWNVTAGHTLQLDGVNVELGTLNGAGTITNSHASNFASFTARAGNFTGSINDGVVFGGMSVNKAGPGSFVLGGTSTYTGPTNVLAGSFIALPGSLGATNVTVNSGAEFGARLATPGSTLLLPSLTTSGATAATVSFDFGSFGNPFAVPMAATTFNVGAPTFLKVIATGLTPGTFPLLDYTGDIGGLGVPGLTLALPPRVAGSLFDDAANTMLTVTITGFDTPKWTGAVDGKWDIDDGAGGGTLNWKEIASNNTTRYIQTATGSDTVLFDDTAVRTSVSLEEALQPTGLTIDNTTAQYTFTGAGRLTGITGLIKSGTGIVRLHNTGLNDYSGGTTINAGSIEIGDGATAGAGSLGTGAVTNHGTLILNRPDSFAFGAPISGFGGLVKNGAGSVTFGGNVTQSGPVAINGGGLIFSAGGLLSGATSGPGTLTASGGVFELNGGDPNTHTGLTTVSAGTLRLSKAPSVSAVGGDVLITGPGVLAIAGTEQIPDTASITFTGTSGDSTAGTAGTETVTAVHAHAAVPTGQFIMRNNFTATGMSTLQNGILGVASSHSARLHGVTMSGGILRIAGSAGPSVLNVGPGGIIASGGVIEVKFNVNDQDATLNLEGDFIGTGNVAINNANYTGFNLNQVVLIGQRAFDLAAGTTVTVRPDLAGAGGLIKAGAGTLDLLGPHTYSGSTIINGGVLRTSTAFPTSTASIAINDGGTLELRIPVSGTSMTVPSAVFGSVTGSTTRIDLSGLGNPTIAPIVADAVTTKGANILAIVGATVAGTFPLIDYAGAIGGDGFAGFSLQLPLRVAGSLSNNEFESRIDVTILGTDTPKWRGDVNANWDVDDGTGTGTANWRGNFSNNALRYLQGSAGTDGVIFNDSAVAAQTAVNLTTVLTPAGVTVDNTDLNYTFTGAGKLSGTGTFTKTGTGLLILSNTGVNEYSGATTINAGGVQIGDGATVGGGSFGLGAVINQGVVTLNRPDDFTVANAISGGGQIIKAGANTATLIGALTYGGPTTVNAGTLVLDSASTLGGLIEIAPNATLRLNHATGTVSGVVANRGKIHLTGSASLNAAIEGTGGIEINTPGAKAIGGGTTNTFTGITTVTAGTLTLNKGGSVAIGGDLVIDGGIVTVGANGNQFADTSNIIVNTGQLVSVFAGGINKDDTIANLTINAATPVSSLNGFNITGTLTITAGAQHDAVNSSGTTTANRALLSNTNIRLGANSGPSTLNFGTGGLSLTNASIVYGSAGTAAQLGMVNLGGDVTGSGTSAFDVNTGNPISTLNLGGATRVFNIVDGTTTVESSIVSSAPGVGLVKTGAGTLVLAAGTNTNGESNYSGDTVLNEGTFLVNGSLSGSNVIVNQATLAGAGIINPGTAGVSLKANAKLAPGLGAQIIGTLTVNGAVDLTEVAASNATAALQFDLESPFFSDRVTMNTGALTLGNGTLNFDDFAFAALFPLADQTTYVLFETNTAILGSLGPNPGGFINGVYAELQFADNQTDLVLFVPEPGSTALILAGMSLLGASRRRRNHCGNSRG